MTEAQTKLRPLPLRVHSRVRVVSVVIRAGYSRYERCCLLKSLDTTGTVIRFDPRWALPFYVSLDNGDHRTFSADNLEVLGP